MAHFGTYSLLECKRFLSKRNLIVWFIVLLIALFFADRGIREFRNHPEKEQKFKQIQTNYFKKLPNYEGYSLDGIKFLFVPSPLGILFKNTVIPPDLTAKVDSIVTLQINNSMKGRSLNTGHFFGQPDFSLIFLLGISLLIMFYGNETLHKKEYLKLLSGTGSHLGAILSIVLTRFLLAAAGFLCICGGLLLYLEIRGIELSAADYTGLSGFIQLTLVMLLLFFMTGFFWGTFRSLVVSITSIFISWFVLIIVVPAVIVLLNGDKFPGITKDFQTELNNFDIVTEFEKRCADKEGKFDRKKIGTFRKLVEEYWNNDFKKIEALEEMLKREIESTIHRINRLAIFSPATFYMLTCSEISGKGYGSYLLYYSYVQSMRRKFVRFWIDRVFYNDPKEMVSFIKGDENIFRSASRLPDNFGSGMSVILFYIIVLFFVSYFRVNRILFPQPEKARAFDEMEIDLGTGKRSAFRSGISDFSNQFLNVFFGKPRGLKWKVSIDGKDIVNKGKREFVYLPHPDNIPGDLKAGHLLYLFKRLYNLSKEELAGIKTGFDKDKLSKPFGKLEKKDKALLFLRVAELKKSSVYIFKDFLSGIPFENRDELTNITNGLKSDGTVVVDLVTGDTHSFSADELSTIFYNEGKYIKR